VCLRHHLPLCHAGYPVSCWHWLEGIALEDYISDDALIHLQTMLGLSGKAEERSWNQIVTAMEVSAGGPRWVGGGWKTCGSHHLENVIQLVQDGWGGGKVHLPHESLQI